MKPDFGDNLTDEDFNALLDALNKTALVSLTDDNGKITYANQ